jgi:hypothetical protein
LLFGRRVADRQPIRAFAFWPSRGGSPADPGVCFLAVAWRIASRSGRLPLVIAWRIANRSGRLHLSNSVDATGKLRDSRRLALAE